MAASRWSAEDLADRAGIASPIVRRIEQHDAFPHSSRQTLSRIENALESVGITFVGTAEDAPGICVLHPCGARSTLRIANLPD